MTAPWRNAEHYMDLTAYTAIKNVERERNMLPKKGEIWSVDYNGVEKTAVVIAAHERYCSVLMLYDEKKNEKQIKVIAKSIMYTEPAMISYAFYERFVSLIKSMPDNDFSKLLGCVADALCIQMDEQTDKAEEYKKQLMVYKVELEALRQNNAELKEELERCQQPTLVNGDAEMAALRAERDVYKALYTETLQKLIDGR